MLLQLLDNNANKHHTVILNVILSFSQPENWRENDLREYHDFTTSSHLLKTTASEFQSMVMLQHKI